MNGEIHSRATVQYKIEILRKGEVIASTDFRPHLITDAGLDNVGASSWLQCVDFPLLGNNVSPTPVRRDSGAVTFTQTGNVLSTVGAVSFFQASDVGRLFKWGAGSSGVEMYITSFTSASSVLVGVSATVAVADVGTIWYVNTASILSNIAGLTYTTNNNVAENFSTPNTVGNVCTVTNQKTFYSSAFASATTLTEIAFNASNTNANVTDRDLISPTVAVLAGDQAKIILQTIISYTPVTSQAVGNVGTGFNSAGNVQLESLCPSTGAGVNVYSSSGALSSNSRLLEPGFAPSGNFSVFTASPSFVAFNATTPSTSGTMASSNSGTVQAYGSGNKYRDSIYTFSIVNANGTIYGWTLGSNTGRFFTQIFTTPFTKLNTQTLSFTIRKSWSRVLTN